VSAIRRLLRRRRDEPPAPAVAAGRRVTVWIRGLGRTAGTVAATTSRGAEITLAVDPRFGDDTSGAADAVVEHTAARGLYRQPGSVRFNAGGGSVSFAPSEQPSLMQRRDFVRLPVDLTVSARLEGQDKQLELHVINLSASGLLLDRAGDGLDDATTVWLSIPLGDGMSPLTPRGTVVRRAPADAHGVEFDYIADSDQERLARFVMREQVRLRRQGKL